MEQTEPGTTRALAQYAAGQRFAALPAPTVHAFKRVLLDYLTCALTGAQTQVARTLREYLAQIDALKDAAVVGTPLRLSAPNAAFANGTAAHGLDFDDGHTQASAHPAGATLPALLAAAEAGGAGAASIVTATVVAYDVMLRIARALHPVSARRGFHNTPVAGVFGAAAGCANLLGLDTRATLNALGLAGSFAGGLREYLDEGADVKRIHPGKAARDGVICAELARRGLSGPSRVLEGRHGLLRAVAGEDANLGAALDGLGSRFAIDDAYFKPYPCCRHFHAAIDAIAELKRAQPIDPAAVERIDVGLYQVGYAGHEHRHCDNLLDAQMSAPCAAVLALLDEEVTAQSFAPESVGRAEFQELIGRTHAYVDDECERIYPGRRSGAVSIRLRGGQTVRARVVDPRGEGDKPLTDEDLERKFVANCEPIAGRGRCERLLAAVWRFETRADVEQLYRWGDG